MKKYLLFTLTFLTILITLKINAQENWEFFKAEEYCFIQSYPIKTVIPEGKSRGDYGMLVYKLSKSSELIVQITAGFNYKSSNSIDVKIDDGNYKFYTDDDTAWAEDDKKLIYAMKKGLVLVTSGVSGKGTKVVDTYSLKGFTSSVNRLSEDC